MTQTIEIKNRFTGEIIFTHRCEENSILITVLAAVKSNVNLSDANLWGADLSRANLSGADLSGADLSRADLSRANLSEAYLSGAYLSEAYLWGGDLRGAYLKGADLSEAYLSEVNLSEANLSEANLWGAYLRRANLWGANLWGANLKGADLRGADLKGANLSEIIIPIKEIPAGDLIGWKKCAAGIIVKLCIPAAARRSAATTNKCRAEYADVLEIENADAVCSTYSPSFVYRVGHRVKAEQLFDDNRWNECSSGIHFFLSREEAEKY